MILTEPNGNQVKINIPSINCFTPTALSGIVHFPIMEFKETLGRDDTRWWDWLYYKEKNFRKIS